MLPQLQQIAALYAANRQNWWIFGWITLMMLPGLAFLAPDAGHERISFFVAVQLIGMPAGACVFLLNTQAKWQFVSPRARLLPGYAAPHLAFIVLLAVPFLLLIPLLPSLAGYNALGALAFAAAVASTFLWSLHASNPLISFTALGLLFSASLQPVAQFWLHPDQADRWLHYHLAILTAGWIALAAWLWRLTRMREDSEDYYLPIQAQVGNATRTDRTIASRAVLRQLLNNKPTRWICDLWHDRLALLRAHTTASRQRLLRYGFSPTPSVVNALYMGVIFFIVLWLMSQSFMRTASNPSAVIPSLNILLIMPALGTLYLLAARRTYMAQELQRPLTRRHYVDGLLRAAARHALVGWFVVHLTVIALLAIVTPTILTWPFVAALTALSLATQIYGFGAMAWAGLTVQGGKRIVLMFVALIPALIGVGFGLGMLTEPDLTRIELDRQTEEQIAQSTAALDPADNADAIAEIAAHERQRAELRWQEERIRPVAAWIAAASLATLGVAIFIPTRRRWLQLELG